MALRLAWRTLRDRVRAEKAAHTAAFGAAEPADEAALVGAGEAVADRVAHQSIPTSVAAGVVVELAWRGLAGDPTKSLTTPTEEKS